MGSITLLPIYRKVSTLLDRQLNSAVGFQQGTAGSHFEQVSDELVGIRARLSRYLRIPRHKCSVGVSAFETLENLARISALPTPFNAAWLKPPLRMR